MQPPAKHSRHKSLIRSPSKNGATPLSRLVPLNDDSAEKQRRRDEKSARDIQNRSNLIAAATPRRALPHQTHFGSSPLTPDDQRPKGLVPITPAVKVPILADFEEWMKLATDNKINATNSWNFALIDYFHEMSLLRDGDGINFQKASCTLDGCVKIYTSRIDSVATETGKLLSGLADSSTSKKVQSEEDGDLGSGDEKAKKRRANRSEATLVKDFAVLQIKKFDLEFSVDPLFKKTSADFDEGGAKGLLLNHLCIDGEGRIVFDASDAAVKDKKDETNEHIDIDIFSLRNRFLPDLELLDEKDICPSLKDFEFGNCKNFDIPWAKDHLDSKTENSDSSLVNDGDDPALLEDNDSDPGVDLSFMNGLEDDNPIFGEGGDAWANESVAGEMERASEGFGPLKNLTESDYVMVMKAGDENNLFAYFDQALRRNWAGPEHWRIQRLKKENSSSAEPRKRKEKEVFQIDFMDADNLDEDSLFSQGGATIYLPKTQWKSTTRNLLPDDIHFSSKQLLSLFIKPNYIQMAQIEMANMLIWTKSFGRMRIRQSIMKAMTAWKHDKFSTNDVVPKQTYDANFFHDDDGGVMIPDDDDDFVDARESPDIPTATQEGNFGSDLIAQARRAKSEYVNFARVAKKVDVRKLKENIWQQLDLEDKQELPDEDTMMMDLDVPSLPPKSTSNEPRRFTEIINGLAKSYTEKAMADISTSFCFICLLHLANEKGLEIKGSEQLDDLIISKDLTVEGTEDF
ncbi:Condensin complex subunit 2 [Neolecta irregularis DAH-3]|uniref:Condensin complex subunit 2 n=1 Tax=Neolecta irregularis (strain DAH-3) TaxID=1198029 RepID=A0A1U7LQ16_NEOID|nr:Condensin complex subunit 2 [Neolecta irregularis DAH-3]|eukprot:OLL24718.1 Condensin complex subunit 2 [Neolecta irregularis DAH-3]